MLVIDFMSPSTNELHFSPLINTINVSDDILSSCALWGEKCLSWDIDEIGCSTMSKKLRVQKNPSWSLPFIVKIGPKLEN